ncbi:MAG: hypothetical protein ABFE08_23595 [Armatimonadia bacterium]
MVISILALLFLCQVLLAQEAVQFLGKPVYTKIAVTQDGTKVLAIAFDRSKGDDGPYDVAYADTNFNGVFEASEKLVPELKGQMLVFPTLSLQTPYNKFGEGTENPVTLSLTRSTAPYGGERISSVLRPQLARGEEKWEYEFRKDLQLFTDLKEAVVATAEPLTTNITARAGTGSLGVAVRLSAGDFSINCRTPQGSPRVRVVAQSANGQVASDTTVELDRLGFG